MSLRRILADQAFSRIGGASLVTGNAVRLLRDAAENYPAWREAIAGARRTVHFESYIIHDDPVGREFAELLAARARAGVEVRLLYDWFGGLGHAGRRFWRDLRAAGVEVRCFNPPRFDSPFGWLSRDHRKVISIEGSPPFISASPMWSASSTSSMTRMDTTPRSPRRCLMEWGSLTVVPPLSNGRSWNRGCGVKDQ